MELKLRKIGNAVGVIFPKTIITQTDFHAGDTLNVHINKNGVSLKKENNNLKENILKGILASDNENVDFSNSFNDTDNESW